MAPKTPKKKPNVHTRTLSTQSADVTSPAATPGSSSMQSGGASSAQTTPASHKKARRLARIKKSGPARTPGSRENARTFLQKIWEREGECAAYLGYRNIGDFRRFAISPYILKRFNQLGDDRTGVRVDSVLEILRDCPDDMQSNEDPGAKFPRSHKGKGAFRVALIVAQARREIEKARFDSTTCTKTEVEKACKDFEQSQQKRAPRVNPIDTPLVFPQLGPFNPLGEDDLEAYARVLALIKYVQYASNAPWDARFGSEDWDASKDIGLSHVPDWMIAKDDKPTILAPDHPSKPAGLPLPTKPAISMNIIWKLAAKTKEARDYVAYLDEEDMRDSLPVMQQVLIIQPAARREHVLDSVRRLYGLHELQAQIHVLRLQLVGDEEFELDVLQHDWAGVQQALWSGGWNPSKSAFTMITRRAEEGEVIFQNAIPFEVEQIMGVIDGDIARLAPDKDDVEDRVDHEYDGYVRAIQDGSRERKVLDPAKMFEGRHAEMIRFYDGHDPTNEAGLLAWQRQAFDAITKGDQRKKTRNTASFRNRKVKLDQAEAQVLADARTEGEQTAFGLEEATGEDEETYHRLNQIHTGTSSQVGLPLNPCAVALEMTAFTNAKGKGMYRSNDPKLQKCAFYAWQVTGACSALVGAIGYVPVREDAPPDVKAAAKTLTGLAIGGMMIVDQTGLGKTVVLLANYYFARAHVETDAKGKPIYKIMVLVVPAAVLKQWADEIIDRWPALRLIISYDDTGLTAAKYKPHFVSATAIKAYPEQTHWPNQFRYIFDPSDPRTGDTLLLTSNETHVQRTLSENWVFKKLDDEGRRVEERVRFSILRGVVGRGGIDEGHKYKDDESIRWKAYADMQPPINWILGATPMSNTSIDFIAQLRIIWIGAKRLLDLDAAASKWVAERRGSMTMWSDGERLEDPLDKRRIGFLHPPTVAYLLDKGTKIQIARFFPLCENLVCIKRFMGSKLPLDFDSDSTYNMQEDMMPYEINTLSCSFRDSELPSHQALHREAARRFMKIGIKNLKTAPLGGGKGPVLYPVAEMRELLITAVSSKLRLFHEACKALDTDTYADTLREYRSQGFDGFRFVRFMCIKQNLALPDTAIGYMVSICEGSPLLRSLIYELCVGDRFLRPRKNGKFLVTEEVPLCGMFLDWALNMLGIETAVFHAGLSQKERNELQEDFNDGSKSLSGCIIFYDVGGVGINLWQDCHTVFMGTAAKNEAGEKQAMGRAIRAPQEFVVEIVKIFVEGSIFAYRESRKRDKYIVELATRAQDPALRSLIVKCLNSFQETVRAAQSDPRNLKLMEHADEMREIERTKQQLVLADAVADKMDVEELPEPKGKRVSKPVKRFAEADWVKGKEVHYDTSDDEDYLRKSGDKSTSKRKLTQKRILDLDEDLENADDSFEDESDWNPDADDEEEDLDANSGSDIEFDIPLVSDLKRTKKEVKMAALALMRREDQEDEAVRQLRLLLTADPNKVYTLNDLNDEVILERGLEITYCMRTGQSPDKVPSIHINYGAISHALGDEAKIEIAKGPSDSLLSTLLTTSTDHAPDIGLAQTANSYADWKATDLSKECRTRGLGIKGKSRKDQFIGILTEDDLKEKVTASGSVAKDGGEAVDNAGGTSKHVSEWRERYTKLDWKQ